jgi:hypothetical protein
MSERVPPRVERPLFAHEPRTEQEVVCIFAIVLPFLQPRLIIDLVQTAFPDCRAREVETNRPLRIELELYSRHFLLHGHNAEDCDVLVCWRDDHGKWPELLRVIELSREVARHCPGLIQDPDHRDPRAPWDRQSFLERANREGILATDLERILMLWEFAETHQLGIQWLASPTAVFAIGDNEQLFKVDSTGLVVFPFSRLECGTGFSALIERLNASIGRKMFVEADARTKGKRGRLSELWPTKEQFQRFLEVWTWFRTARVLPG